MAVDLDALKTLLTNKLREKFGEQVIDFILEHHEITILIDRDALLPIMEMLRDDPDFRFNFLSYVTCVDYLAHGRTPRFAAVYHLYSVDKKHRVRVRAAIPEDDPAIDSVYPLWQSANFMEREAFDMFGVIFRGHPDLRRILMPDDWEGHPLRKDFPLGGVKSFYFKRSSDPHAGEPKTLVPRIRVQESDI
jgi:NADH-quinone oxidoreductase subunit C